MLALLLALALPQDPAPIRTLVTIDLAAEGVGTSRLLAADLDVTAARPGTGVVEVLCDADDLALLDGAGIGYRVLHADLTRHYAERAARDARTGGPPSLGAWLVPPFGSGSMGGFYTFAEVESVLDQIVAAYPALTSGKTSIGSSLQGRSLWALKVSDDPGVDEDEPEVRFDALHHAREPQGMQTTLWVLLCLLENYGTDPLATYLVDERELWFLPVVNPDGYVYNQSIAPGGGGLWRKNRRDNGNGTTGVDLNRNYAFEWGFDDAGSSPSGSSEVFRGPSPASEPEVAAMQAFLDAHDFQAALTVHTYGDLWLYPWGYDYVLPVDLAEFDEISTLATSVNGYLAGPGAATLYAANGVTDDYDYGVHGTFAWTPEIGDSNDGFWPAPSRIVPLAEENELAFLTTAWAAGAYLHESGTTLVDLGDGDGNPEPGEDFEVVVEVRNSGRASASATVGLTTSDPLLVVTTPGASLSSVPAFSSADNAASPLAFSIAGGASFGTRISFRTTLTYEGFTQVREHTYALGDAQLFLVDDVEVDVGWTVGLPSDGAATGLWEHGDPVGTTYNGQPSNPEDDATPAPGVSAFTTGNGSTSAGGDDVDGGVTTLITPAIDLSGVSEAFLSYARWFANLGDPADDALVVSISDDGGASWLPLETVSTNRNAWNTHGFFVSDFVGLTDGVKLRFEVADDPNNSLTEASIDDLTVTIFDPAPRFHMYGRPAIGTPFALHLTGEAGQSYVLYASPGTGVLSLPGVQGDILLSPTGLVKLLAGSIPAGGLERIVSTLPNDPGLPGNTFYVQAATIGGGIRMSNRATVTFE